MNPDQPNLALTRPFGWGLLLLLDSKTSAIPEIMDGSVVHASDEGVAVLVRHAQDVDFDGLAPDEIVPLAEVAVRVYVGAPVPDSRIDAGQISVPSGTVTIGDADQEDPLDIGVGRYRVGVVCAPSEHADQVELWLQRVT